MLKPGLYPFLFLWLTCYLLLCSVPAGGQTDYFFKQISIREELSQTTVRCILCDDKGQIWAGTQFGLNRFDREEMKHYLHEPGNPFSLPHNKIYFCAEDSLSGLWVGTEEGVAVYRQESDDFLQAVLPDNRNVSAQSYLLTDTGMILGGKDELFAYSYRNRKIEALPFRAKEKINDYFRGICPLSPGKLLLSTRWNGCWIYEEPTGGIERCPFIPFKDILALYTDSRQITWVAPYGKGIYGYDVSGHLLYCFTTENSALKNNIVLDIVEKDGELWLATDGGGIGILNPETRTVRTIEHQPGNNRSLPVNSFYCLYSDNEDNIWAGSIRGGIIGVKEVHACTYKDAPLNTPYGLSEKTVVSLYEDTDGTLWIGTDGGGVNRFDPHTRTFRHYPDTYGKKIVSLVRFNDRELLVSCFGEGLYIFDKQTGQSRPLRFRGSDENDYFSKGISVNLVNLSDTLFYLLGYKTYAYAPRTGRFTEVPFPASGSKTVTFQEICTEGDTTYLLNPYQMGLLDSRRGYIEPFLSFPKEKGEMNAAYRARSGEFWLGTTTGLYRYNPATKKLMGVSSALFDNINTLLEDAQGRVWIGTQRQLFAYSPVRSTFILLGETDGVSANEYLFKPTLRARNGDLYMGGVNGLLYIKNDMPFPEYPEPVIRLLDVLVDGTPAQKADKNGTNRVTVPWNHTSLAVKIIAKENDLLRKKLFRFRVEGLSGKSIDTYTHTLLLRSLPPGDYRVWVSCNKKDGNWSAPVEILSVEVRPPWWKTVWFFLLCLTAVVVSAGFFIRLAMKRKEERLQLEMKEHEKKTYEEKVRFLINISHELRTPLTLIYAPLQRLLRSGEVKGALAQQLTTVYKQARQMKNLINMVLNVRKMEVGQGAVDIRLHRLPEWLWSVAEDFALEFSAKNMELVYELDPAVTEVPFDDAKCEIILSNLLMNALKFSEAHTCITISTQKISGFVRIAVSDQGIGLNGVDANRLFTRFYQGDPNRDGSGIGLSYSRVLVELQGGRIHAFDNPDKGATFFFELPAENRTGKSLCEARPYLNELLFLPEQPEPEARPFDLGIYTLMIVEDEPELRNYLKETLKEYFKNVYAAEDGQAASDMICSRQPDLVISDVMMPRMNGFELCKIIKEDVEISHIPVILLTARDDTESMCAGYKIGADSYVTKPFDMDFLLTVIRNLLRNREAVKLEYKKRVSLMVPEESTFSQADEQFLLKLNRLIADNIGNSQLEVRFLAAEMAMSRASLYNKMKAICAIGINDYINKIRMEKAVHLLLATDASILEISEQCGFSNQRYFSTVFKQLFNATPSKYRQEKKRTGNENESPR